MASSYTVYLSTGEPMPLPAALERIRTSTDMEFLSLCLSHYSGYMREAAIGRAVELGDRSLLGAIVERVNDWVPEVRTAAMHGLLTLLATVPAKHFIPLIPRLRGLMLATRANHRSWLSEFEERLIEAGGSQAILDAATGTDFRLRRAAFFVSVDHQLLTLPEMIELGLRTGDIVVAKSAVALLGRIPFADRAKYIALAMAAPFGPVRLAALDLIRDGMWVADYEPFLWRATFDSQGRLRSAATRLLTHIGRDVVARCSAMLDSGEITSKQLRAGLSLLAELRAPDLVETLARYATDARAQIRAHVVALQAKWSPALKDQIASRALLDSSRQVRKAGVRLCTSGAFVSLDLIRTMLAKHGDCRAALAICERDKWESLACITLIAELDAPASDVYSVLRETLRRWVEDPTSSWTTPSGEQRRILSSPGVALRLFELDRHREPKLRERLREGGITLQV
jgi:hypothetical protein